MLSLVDVIFTTAAKFTPIPLYSGGKFTTAINWKLPPTAIGPVSFALPTVEVNGVPFA